MKMRRTRTCSIFSILLSVALIISMMPSFAFANAKLEDKVVWAYTGETGQDGTKIRSGAKWMRVNDKYYYDFLKGTGGMDTADNYSKEDFYKEMIAGHLDKSDPECIETMPYSSTNEFSALGQWAALAAKIFVNYKSHLEPSEGFNINPVDEGTIKRYLGNGNAYNSEGVYSEGLQTASSLKTVYDEACINAGLENHDSKLLDDEKSRDVVYKIVKIKNPGTGYQYSLLAFYDFKLSPILSKFPYITAAEGYESIESAAEASKPGVYYHEGEGEDEKISYFKNESETSNSVSLNLSKSINESLSNTMGKSESYSFTEAVGYTNSISLKANVPIFGECTHDRSWSFNFTTNQTFGTSESETKSQSETVTDSSTSGVTLPGHTAAQIKTSSNTMRVQLRYACPVTLTYKVYMGITNASKMLMSSSAVKSCFYETIFGSDATDDKKTPGTTAQENLYLRAVEHVNQNGYEKVNSNCYGLGFFNEFGTNGIDWKNIYDYDNTYDIIDWLTNNYVMSYTGGKYDYNADSQITQMGAIVPLYDLYGITLAEYTQFGDIKIDDNGNIKILNDDNFKDAYDLHDFRMAPGEVFYPRSLTLAPYNRYMVDYYGFKTALGSWKKVKKVQEGDTVKWVLDESGETDDVAKIVSDEVSGYQRIDAGEKEGEVYFQYFINETTSNYYSVENEDPVTNDDISRPVIKIKVENKPFKGTIKFREDNFKAETGTAYNLKSVFDPAVYDEDGKLANREIEWRFSDATEAKRGTDFTFDDVTGDIEFFKEGKYTVIAGTGEATEAEYTIVVENAKLSLDAFCRTICVGDRFTFTLTDSSVNNPNPSNYTWESSNDEVATVNNYGKVTGVAAGTTTITVSNGKGSSASCEVTVENVAERPFKGSVRFRNDNFKVTELNKEYDLVSELDPGVYDEEGRLIEKDIEWQLSPATQAKEAAGALEFDATNGKIKFKQEGRYTVIAGTGEATKAEYTIVVKQVKLLLDTFTKTIGIGDEFTLILADSSVDNPNPTDYTWTSSNTDVATVSPYGKVTGKAAGTTIITVSNGLGNSADCEVSVENSVEKPFEGTILFRNNTAFKVVSGDSFNLNEKLSPVVFDEKENLVQKTVSWKLSLLTKLKELNGDVTLDIETGYITFNKDGEYTIIASVGNATAELTITVDKVAEQKEEQQTGGGGSGGGGGGADQTTPEVKPTNVDVQGTVTTENGENVAKADVSNKVDELINNAKTSNAKEVTINVKSTQDVDKVNVTLPADSFEKLAQAGVENAVISTNVCDFAIDKTALAEIAAQAPDGSKLTLEAVESPSKNNTVNTYDLRITADGKEISKFNGGKVVVTVDVPAELKGKSPTCLYKSDKGKYSTVTTEGDDTKLSFTAKHFSTYVVMSELRATKLVVKQATVKKNTVNALRNGNVKVSFSKAALGNLVAPEEVKYTVQRSTSKNFNKQVKNYTVNSEQKTIKFTDSKKLRKGTKYYYRVRGTVVTSTGSKVKTNWSSVKSAKCK